MAKAPDLSPRALSLVDKILARLPASVSDLETWWERQGKVTRLELRRILRQLDGDRLMYDRDAGMVKPVGTTPATKAPTPGPTRRAPIDIHATTKAMAAASTGKVVALGPSFEPPPVIANVGGVTFTGSAAAVKAATEAYQRALLSPPTTPRPPAKRGPQPSAGSVSERVRASVCRKPGTVGEVIARFPDVNPNTIRGALGTLKGKGLVSHTDGKYGAHRG